MSSTIRVFVNNKRVATGKPHEGKFLQVHPSRKTFASEGEWRSAVYQSVLNSIRFDVESAPASTSGPGSTPAPSPALAPASTPTSTRSSQSATAPRSTPAFSTKPSDWTYKDKSKAILPPGTYYIGDPCYALDDALYDRVFGPAYDTGLFTSNLNPSHLFMMEGTGGDGTFRGSDGKVYPVDAGILGIVSEALLKTRDVEEFGSIYTFKSPVHVTLTFDDKFIFRGDDYSDPHITIKMYHDDDESYESSE